MAIYGPVAQTGFAGRSIKTMTDFEHVLNREEEKQEKREKEENKKIEKSDVKPENLE